MDKNRLHGVHTALVTPMQDGAIAYADLERLIQRQLESKVSGLVPCGTTGESPTLTEEEHLQVIRTCIEGAKGDSTIIAGTGANSTAEAIHLANKTGLNPNQLYHIVNTAAGQSWMFTDRGSRMLPLTDNHNNDPQQQVKSALNLFVKDLNIVQSESQTCASPIPIATAALQQFLIGKSLGLGKLDDSQIYKVYQQQSQSQPTVQKDNTWLLPSGEQEQIVDVGDEARHEVVISNDYTRIMKISFPPGDTTTAHRYVPNLLFMITYTCNCIEYGIIHYLLVHFV